MISARRLRLGMLLLCILALAGWAWVAAASGPAADWTVIGAGGAPADGGSGSLRLNGTLGQAAIGPSEAASAGLGAGFWYGLGRDAYQVYLPLVLRGF
jgi:hypothetical protein